MESWIVKLFKEQNLFMWFREPIEDEDAVYNNLPLIK